MAANTSLPLRGIDPPRKLLINNGVTGAVGIRGAELLKCGVRNSDCGIQFAAAAKNMLYRKLLIVNDVTGVAGL
jgi:hypothetical protein